MMAPCLENLQLKLNKVAKMFPADERSPRQIKQAVKKAQLQIRNDKQPKRKTKVRR